jgi:hypothetical protein
VQYPTGGSRIHEIRRLKIDINGVMGCFVFEHSQAELQNR